MAGAGTATFIAIHRRMFKLPERDLAEMHEHRTHSTENGLVQNMEAFCRGRAFMTFDNQSNSRKVS